VTRNGARRADRDEHEENQVARAIFSRGASLASLSEQVTVYVIEPHRGYAEAAAIPGEDYAGFLVHDGARCFYGFEQAFHQSCPEHLTRRCREMIVMASAAAAQFPMAVKTLLQEGLRLRDRYQRGEHGSAVDTGRLEAQTVVQAPAPLRAALRLPGRRIAQLNFGRRDDPVLAIMRRVWRDSRAVARAPRSARGNEATTRPLAGTDITA